MSYVKAPTSARARKYLATVEGRRRLLELYLGGPGRSISVGPGGSKRGANSTPGGETNNPKR